MLLISDLWIVHFGQRPRPHPGGSADNYADERLVYSSEV